MHASDVAKTLVLSATVLAATAGAHHGWSGYDDSRTITLTGEIKESGYEQPHGFIRLTTTDKTWRVILAPPSRMKNRGLPPEALSPGKKATVVGYPHRTLAEEMRAERITIDGKTTELR
jgi:hypothetical protein